MTTRAVNIVTSSDHLVGEVITTSPDVDMVAFIGSTATGKRIMEAASAALKEVFREVGGKSWGASLLASAGSDARPRPTAARRRRGALRAATVGPRRPALRPM